jgi:plasmid stabilization system protein ParE
MVASARLVGGGVVVGDDDEHQDDEAEAPASREAALAWLRAIRAELAAMSHEPPAGRRRPPPPPARARPSLRERLEAIEGENRTDPPEKGR